MAMPGRALGVVTLVLFSWACGIEASVPPLTPAAQSVQMVKGDPPSGATLVGPIEVTHGGGCGGYGRKGTLEGAMNAARLEAAERGADYVSILTITEPHSETGCYDQGFTIRGMAYKLGEEPAAPASTPAAAPARAPAPATAEFDGTCTPPCSPGYACSAGVCEPQCNPACAADKVCGPERVCVAAPAAAN